MDAFSSMEMISMNKCHVPGQTAVTYYSCLTNLLDESIFLKYLQFVAMFSVLVIFIIIQFFIVPLFIIFLIYFSSLLLLIYQRTHKLKGDYYSSTWDGARLILATLWDRFGKFWHGYELHGTENLPDGPGLIIYYHGAIPIDYLYFLARLFLLKNRFCHSIADDYVFRFPGVKTLADVMCIAHPTKEVCLNILKNGHLLGISPGGVREALFSDKSYKLVWCKRKGFAQVAIDAKVPIIPMYTQNVREGFRVFGKSPLAKWMYEHVRLPFLPPYGGFPVKFRTFLGEPIPYDPNITADELATKTKNALQSLIQSHQQIPGSICSALMERFQQEKKKSKGV